MTSGVLRKSVFVRWASLVLLCGLLACGGDDRPVRDGGFDFGSDGARDSAVPPRDAAWNPDAACAIATESAVVDLRPVDIIFVVDNSASMEPAIVQVQAGLNDFADRIGDGLLDFSVIMLSLRGTSGGDRFPVCIPPPLAGDGSCGDGPRFHHVSVDIRSTQPVEQILGTLGQTNGYTSESARGSEPWRSLLRDDSTKTLVVVTDDNARTCAVSGGATCDGGDPVLTETSLEDFPGGGNPFNGNDLGPGLLNAEYGTLFEGYTFNAIYGWGSESDPDVLCTFPGGSEPDSSGPTYTTLVARTGGVRAQICDQADSAAWDTFLGAVATRVEETARINCEIELPDPPDGMMLNPNQVNVIFSAGATSRPFGKVAGEAECGAAGGWYYDDDREPTTVILCPSSCDEAQDELRESGEAGIGVAFGCDTVFI